MEIKSIIVVSILVGCQRPQTGDITGVTLRRLSTKKNLKHICRACKSIVVQI